MKLTRSTTRLTFVALAGLVAQACAEGPGAPGIMNPDGEGEPEPAEMQLESFLDVAGRADIEHGTGAYRAPVDGLDQELEQRIFVAFLSGGQEVPPVATRAEGAMALVLDRKRRRLHYVLRHGVEGATVAHLHRGSGGENGPVAVGLPRVAPFSSGVVPLSEADVTDLQAGRLYVNVHSSENAGGAIRGQILRPGETLFVARLSGAEEVPPTTTAASGVASLILGARRDQIRYRISLKDVMPTAAHLHRNIAGDNGPVVYPLALPASAAAGGAIEGTQAITSADVEDLARRQWYVNVHSAAFPMGEVRGQVLRPGESALVASLSGAQEVPAVASDSKGKAMVVLGAAGGKFLYLVNTDATPTAAHIHRAPAGVNGPVEVELGPLGPGIVGVRELGPARAADARRGLWYVNVHTAANAKGELRGQLLAPGETLYTALLSGASETPPVSTGAAGGVGLILDAGRTELRFDGTLTGIAPTVAHVHTGAEGSSGPVAFPLSLDGSSLSGALPVSADDITTLDAAGFYVNIHSAAHPLGEIRGQIVRR